MATNASIDLSLIGDKELRKAFKKMPLTFRRRILRKAFKEVAADILQDARSLVPVSADDQRKRGGMHLRDTLKIENLKRTKGKKIGVIVVTGTREELGIDPEDKYYYPAAIELGTDKTSVQSFLRAALEINRGPGLIKINTTIRKGLDRAAKRAARKKAKKKR